MAKRNTRKDEAQIDELGNGSGQVGSDSADNRVMSKGYRKSRT
jgi:hypothetical protein